MRKANFYDILKHLGEGDTDNGTIHAPQSRTLVSANLVKAGGHVTMGVDHKTTMDIINNKRVCILIAIDYDAWKAAESELS